MRHSQRTKASRDLKLYVCALNNAPPLDTYGVTPSAVQQHTANENRLGYLTIHHARREDAKGGNAEL